MNLLNSSKSLSVVATASAITALLVQVSSSKALADPVPFAPLPDIFCFRFTDIEQNQFDTGRDRFTFEFEVLNWTDGDATSISITRNTGGISTQGGVPFFIGADVDPNGRPIGSGDDENPPGNQNITNDWSVSSDNSNTIRWNAGTTLQNIDLIGIQNSLPPGSSTQAIIDNKQ